jgi:predicted  nucleic acid-binding Zn-ribbon protein
MNRLNLLFWGLPTLVVTGTAFLAGGYNPTAALLTGIASATTGFGASAVLNRGRNDELTRCRLQLNDRETQLGRIDNYNQLIAGLPELRAENRQLENEISEFQTQIEQKREQIAGQNERIGQNQGMIGELQGQRTAIQQNITELQATENELHRRIAEIEQLNPDLATRERLYQDVQGLNQRRIQLEQRLEVLQERLDTLNQQEAELIRINQEIALRSGQRQELEEQLQSLRAQTEDRARVRTELEFLRATYDSLFKERQGIENRIAQLRPELEGLESQKNRIIQEIQQNEQAYNEIEALRRQLIEIRRRIRESQAHLANLEIEIQERSGQRDALTKQIAELERRIKELREEIDATENIARTALAPLRNSLWVNIAGNQRSNTAEEEFLQGFKIFLRENGLFFPDRVIYAFHTSLKVQDISALVILAGISGTGKSALPQYYAKYIGGLSLTLAVQPRWDSPQDLQGFYNYIEKKYKPTDLMRGLYQYQHDPNLCDRLVMVLLDEMNLARVEYYFSDFLSKLETRREMDTYLDLEIGSLPLSENERRLRIPRQFLFVGTMNEDETTQSLSDKVLDRANVLTFGKPDRLQLRNNARQASTPPNNYLSYSHFQSWMKTPACESELINRLNDLLDRTNRIMEKLGHPFAHRVYQAIVTYVINYPGVQSGNEEAYLHAVADSFGQKLLPKLRGLAIEEYQAELEGLTSIIDEINDLSLLYAFERAIEGHYGQFQWRGLIYGEE